MEDNIAELKSLIEDYEDELQELKDMRHQWEEYDDSGSDPGLQYEQECRVEEYYNKVINFAKNL